MCTKSSSTSRPSYHQVDEADREAQLSSRNDVLKKSFAADLWTKVIIRAIDDIALYQWMREMGRTLKEEELAYEESAKSFLFDDEYSIPMDDYLVNITCVKCNTGWPESMSKAAGNDSVCPSCGKKTSWKYTNYEMIDGQVLKNISLKELISLWGVDDIVGFRAGCHRRIQEIVDKKLIVSKNKEKKHEQET